MDELLRLERVSYRYENVVVGLKEVSVAFHRGERVAVLGNNGAGKSTFFLCCNGVLRPGEGALFLKGRHITDAKGDLSRLRRTVGLVFQEPDSQIIAGRVQDEVSFGPINLRLPEEDVRRRVADALAQMHLTGYEARAPQYLSGGEKKRVSIADILAMEPEIILLDEPTASLDPESTHLLEETLDAMSRAGMTVIVSTHDVDFAYRFATRGLVFSRGEVVADADMEELFASEPVLRVAGLRKPLVYEAAELLHRRFTGAPIQPRPKTMAQLQAYIASL